MKKTLATTKTTATPKPILRELAPAQGEINSLLGALSPLSYPGDALPGVDGFGTYRKMQGDPQVKACLATKKFAVLSRGWDIQAASTSADDQAIAQFVRQALTQMRGTLLDALYDVLDALALGVSLVEINWVLRADGKIGLHSLKAKDPALFQFECDPFLNLTGLRGDMGGVYPLDKFLVYTYMPAYENPWGQSDLRAAYRPWFVKEQLLRWWAKYMEKFGMPTVRGTYASGKGYSKKQQMEFLSLVAAIHNESAVVVPDDLQIALLEATRGAEAGFEQAISYLDRAIAKSILGQTLTSDSTSGTNTNALGQIHMDVLGFYLQKLQRDLEQAVVNAQLIDRLVACNFGPDAARPTFHLGALDDSRLSSVGALIKDLVAGNILAPDEPWIRGYLGLPDANSGAIV